MREQESCHIQTPDQETPYTQGNISIVANENRHHARPRADDENTLTPLCGNAETRRDLTCLSAFKWVLSSNSTAVDVHVAKWDVNLLFWLMTQRPR